MSSNQASMSDRDLWRSISTAPAAAPAAVSEMDLAAWLEGRLPDSEMARIEAAVANDAAMRQAAIELSDILGKPLPAAPDRLVVRARSLVGFEAERVAPRRTFFDLGAFIQKAAMVAAAMIVAVTGFAIGGGIGQSYAEERIGMTVQQARHLASRPAANECEIFGPERPDRF